MKNIIAKTIRKSIHGLCRHLIFLFKKGSFIPMLLNLIENWSKKQLINSFLTHSSPEKKATSKRKRKTKAKAKTKTQKGQDKKGKGKKSPIKTP